MTQPVDPFLLNNPDVSCWDDLDPLGNELTSDLAVLEQDVYHILIEVPGSNPDDVGRGVGIENYLSGTDVDFFKLPSIIDAQLRQDDRIAESTTTIIKNTDGTYGISIEIQVGAATLNLPFAFNPGTGVFSRGTGVVQ